MLRELVFTFTSMLLLIYFNNYVFAWAIETHKVLSESASENSVLSKSKGDYLKNFGFEKELEEEFSWNNQNKTVKDWIQEGADLEDVGSNAEYILNIGRANNHYHNPLAATWENAGLDDPVLIVPYTGMSSVLWAQDSTAQLAWLKKTQRIVSRSGGWDWSWQTIRTHYYQALTAATAAERQAYFARTFRGLGHQMHLIQDAAQPDHVRNDNHFEDSVFNKNRSGSFYFEEWAKNKEADIRPLAAQPIFPTVPLDLSRQEGLAPITQLIDANQYTGSNPSASLAHGIAEYTNANFFSDDTIFAAEEYPVGHRHHFPYPQQSSTNLQQYIDGNLLPKLTTQKDQISDLSFWIAKVGDGEYVEHLVKPTYLTRAIYNVRGVTTLYQRTFYRDEECHKDYAKHLIPRAVGYSAALVDYFFRGQLALEQAPGGQTQFVIVNHADEPMDGKFELYYDSTEQGRIQIWSSIFSLGGSGSGASRSQPFDLTAPDDAQNPGLYILVFRGKLGAEDQAVVGAVIRLFTTLTGTVLNRAGQPVSVLVKAVAGEDPHRYERGVSTDANGAFVVDNFPADRGEIHIEVWSKCSICSQVHDGPGSMIPPEQLIFESSVSFADYPKQTRFDYGRFPAGFVPVSYRAKTEQKPPILNGQVDFEQIKTVYVSVVYDKVTVPGTHGGPLGIWGSFKAEIFRDIPTGMTAGVLHEPFWAYTYPNGMSEQAQCSADDWNVSIRLWTYLDQIWSVSWLQLPTVSTGRIVPHFDDVAGQVIGTINMAFSYRAVGYWSARDEKGTACECMLELCGSESLSAQVQKSGVKATVVVYE